MSGMLTKTMALAGFKTSPTDPTPDQLAKINQYTRREFAADEVYVGQMRLANNAVDRDGERFTEGLLKSFASTIVRKSVLMDHDPSVKRSVVGKFFDAEIDAMPLAEAEAITGETYKLPEGADEVQFLAPWFYIPKAGVDPETIVKIDAGIFDYTSIGFAASSRTTVKDPEGRVLYAEYDGPGEAYEGSLVYLGAQYGAAIKSPNPHTPHTGDADMKQLLGKLSKIFGTDITEENVATVIEAKIGDASEKDATIASLTEKVADLAPKAAMGEKFVDTLVTKYVDARVKLEEIASDEASKTRCADLAKLFPLETLTEEVTLLEKRVAEKFPPSQLKGDDLGGGGTKEKNPLVPAE